MGHKLAIDFGTTNSVIARWADESQSAQVMSIPGLSAHDLTGAPPIIPSLVYVHAGQTAQVSLGQSVREQNLDRQKTNRLFRNFKRGVVASPAPEPRLIDGQLWADRDAAARFVRGLLDTLPPRAEIDQLVLTVPVAAFRHYVDWLDRVVGETADLIRIVDESTAAALGYAVTAPGTLVLVFDFGGGTLDLSLVQLPESRERTGGILSLFKHTSATKHAARVMAKAGRILGGSDVDHWLLLEVLAQTGLTRDQLGQGYAALLTRCEQAKIELSTNAVTTVTVETPDRAAAVHLTRAAFEQLLDAHGFFTTIRSALDKIMYAARQQGIFKEDIQHVLLVGGMSLMPAVQALLRQYFHGTAFLCDKPFTAVAEGALHVAAGAGLDDYLAYSYGLRHLDAGANTPEYDEIVAMGSRYPLDKPIEVQVCAAYEAQTELEFVIGEIDTNALSQVELKYENGEAVFVAQADRAAPPIEPLSEAVVVALNPPGRAGEARLKALFQVDARRQLRLSVIDLQTGQELLHERVLHTLRGAASPEEPGMTARLTGREPRLVNKKGHYRLSLRGLGTMLNVLPPESISLAAAQAALYNKDFFVRYNAARVLRRRGDRAARLIMAEALSNGDAPTRASVARELYGVSWYSAEPLLRQALQDDDVRVHECAVYALCDLRELHGYQLLVEVLPKENDHVKAAAAWGLRNCPDPAAVPVLQAALTALDPDVRVKVLEALGANDTPEALPIVRGALNDSAPDVQYAATLSLVELRGEAGFPEMAQLIEQTTGHQREQVLRGFFHATNYLFIDVGGTPAAEEILSALESALHDRLSAARLAAAWLLAWIRHPRAPQVLKRAYAEETDSEVKAAIVKIAHNLMSEAGAEILEDAVGSSIDAVREAAEQIRQVRGKGYNRVKMTRGD